MVLKLLVCGPLYGLKYSGLGYGSVLEYTLKVDADRISQILCLADTS